MAMVQHVAAQQAEMQVEAPQMAMVQVPQQGMAQQEAVHQGASHLPMAHFMEPDQGMHDASASMDTTRERSVNRTSEKGKGKARYLNVNTEDENDEEMHLLNDEDDEIVQ